MQYMLVLTHNRKWYIQCNSLEKVISKYLLARKANPNTSGAAKMGQINKMTMSANSVTSAAWLWYSVVGTFKARKTRPFAVLVDRWTSGL